MARKDRARRGGARSNLYDYITDKIIAELEEGRLPWVQPWGTAAAKAPLAMPRNAATARQYSGINVLILWGAVIQHGYPSLRPRRRGRKPANAMKLSSVRSGAASRRDRSSGRRSARMSAPRDRNHHRGRAASRRCRAIPPISCICTLQYYSERELLNPPKFGFF